MSEPTGYTLAAIAYAEAVVSARWPEGWSARRAGEGERLACQRFLADLERAAEGWAYWYDELAAAKACAFVETMPHVKGEWRGKPIVLEPCQAFWTCNLFGWRRVEDGLRRFTFAYLEVQRKNAKSTWLAAVLLYMLVEDGEPGAEIYNGATTRDQAKTVWEPMRQMALLSPAWCARRTVEVRASSILHHPSGSHAEPVVGQPGDGGSPHAAGVDEYHEHRTDGQLATMRTGTGARRQPLVIVTTTSGLSTGVPCYALRTRLMNVLRGVLAEETTFAIVYALDDEDDWTDFQNWTKANPMLGVSCREDMLRERYETALADAVEQPGILAKHCGRWGNAAAPFFAADRVMTARMSLDWSDLCAYGPPLLALDGSDKEDLTSAVALAVVPQIDGPPILRLKGLHWLPGTVIDHKRNAHYRQFEQSGHLRRCEGAEIDRIQVENDLAELIERLDVRSFVYDQAYMRHVAQGLEDRTGVERVAWKVGSSLHMGPAMVELKAAFAAGRVELDDDPVLAWALLNIEAQKDNRGNVYPRRSVDRTKKIDPGFAALMALGFWWLNEGAVETIGDLAEVVAA